MKPTAFSSEQARRVSGATRSHGADREPGTLGHCGALNVPGSGPGCGR